MNNRTKDVKIVCIKSVEMYEDGVKNGNIAFISGKIYDGTIINAIIYATNEQGNDRHRIGDLENPERKGSFFDNHFILLKEEYLKPTKLPQFILDVLLQKRDDLNKRANRINGEIESHREIISELNISLSECNKMIAEIDELI